MTLDQFQDLRVWHLRHRNDHPTEGHVWTMVLTLWMVGWVGTPAAWLLRWDTTALTTAALIFLPGLYVWARSRLHRRGHLRCDWLVALR